MIVVCFAWVCHILCLLMVVCLVLCVVDVCFLVYLFWCFGLGFDFYVCFVKMVSLGCRRLVVVLFVVVTCLMFCVYLLLGFYVLTTFCVWVCVVCAHFDCIGVLFGGLCFLLVFSLFWVLLNCCWCGFWFELCLDTYVWFPLGLGDLGWLLFNLTCWGIFT